MIVSGSITNGYCCPLPILRFRPGVRPGIDMIMIGGKKSVIRPRHRDDGGRWPWSDQAGGQSIWILLISKLCPNSKLAPTTLYKYLLWGNQESIIQIICKKKQILYKIFMTSDCVFIILKWSDSVDSQYNLYDKTNWTLTNTFLVKINNSVLFFNNCERTLNKRS